MSVHASVLIVGAGLFFCGLCLHFLLWRIRHPRNHLGALILVFFSPAAVFFLWAFISHPSFPVGDLFAIVLLHASLSCAYIQIYPASQADSPSLRILIEIGRSMPSGMTQKSLEAHFNIEGLVSSGLHDLLETQLTRQLDSRLVLTAKGKAFVLPFVCLRNILGLPAGRG